MVNSMYEFIKLGSRDNSNNIHLVEDAESKTLCGEDVDRRGDNPIGRAKNDERAAYYSYEYQFKRQRQVYDMCGQCVGSLYKIKIWYELNIKLTIYSFSIINKISFLQEFQI